MSHSHRLLTRRAIAVSLVATSLVALTTGCSASSGRSVSAYCHTFWQGGEQIHAEYAPGQNGLTQLVRLIAAPQELATFFARLDKVAPDDIEPDVAVLQNAFQKESDGLGGDISNPVGGLLSGLVNGVSSTGSYTRVDTWTAQHCGSPPS